MAERSTISTHQLEELLDKTGSKFLLVSLAAKRTRQLNDYANGLGRGAGGNIPPQVEDIAHKPLTIAFAEIAADKIKVGEPEVIAPVEEILGEEFEDNVFDIQADLENLDIFS